MFICIRKFTVVQLIAILNLIIILDSTTAQTKELDSESSTTIQCELFDFDSQQSLGHINKNGEAWNEKGEMLGKFDPNSNEVFIGDAAESGAYFVEGINNYVKEPNQDEVFFVEEESYVQTPPYQYYIWARFAFEYVASTRCDSYDSIGFAAALSHLRYLHNL